MTSAIAYLLFLSSVAAYHQNGFFSLSLDDDKPVTSTEKTKAPWAMDSTTVKTGKNLTDAMIANITGSLAAEEEEENNDIDDGPPCSGKNDGTLSTVWYLAAFGGLVLFFFVVTCSELFMQNPVHARRQMDLPHASFLRRRRYSLRHGAAGGHCGPETPPPPYHLFAPPMYDDLDKPVEVDFERCDDMRARAEHGWRTKNPRMFVVPVHHLPPPPLTPCTACPYHQNAPLSIRVVDELANRTFPEHKDSNGK